jgi:hypothetical protein
MINVETSELNQKITKEDVVRVLWYARNQEYPKILSEKEQKINSIYWNQIQSLHHLWQFDKLDVLLMQKGYEDIDLYLIAYIAISILEYFWIGYEKYWEVLVIDQNTIKELKNNWLLSPILEYLLLPTITWEVKTILTKYK